MIIKALLELIFGLLTIVFAPINLPQLPEGIQSVVNQLVDLLVGSVGILGLFLDWNVVKYLVPLVIVIANFDRIWNMIMFILRKIPFIGVE